MPEPGTSTPTSFTVNLSEEQALKLKELADQAGVTPQELLHASLEGWLSHRQEDFARAASYVLKKNAELYRRLA